MKRFSLGSTYEADCQEGTQCHSGEIYHAARNAQGGGVLTPVARYFCWHPRFAEGFNKHWRVDCYVREHPLAPDAEWAGKALVTALIGQQLCSEPIWLSWHKSSELGGTAYGQVFEAE